MLAKHVVVNVHRDMAEVISASCFAHEVPILKEIHGEGNVEIVDEMLDSEPVKLDEAEEYGRLADRYGVHESGTSHVERVYGLLSSGQFEDAGWKATGKKRAKAEATE